MRLRNFRLHDLSPFGPIFGKELRIAARRKRNHLLRVLYLGGLLLFLLMVWSTSYYSYNRAGVTVAERIQQQNQLGQEFFATFSMFCVISMGLIAPVLTSTAISSERLGKTLSVLLMTPITSWQIVSGKLLSRLLIALMLIGLSLPVLAVVRLLGGVEPDQMLAVVLICTAFAMSSGAIGLLFSTLMNRAYAVILLSYAMLLLLYLFTPMLIILWNSGGPGPGMWLLHLIATINPVVAVAMFALPDRPLMQVSWWPCVSIQLGMTVALLLSSGMLLRWFARREGQRSAPPPIDPMPVMPVEPIEAPDAVEPTLPAAPVLAYPSRRLHSTTRTVGDNPVLWRELRKPLLTMRYSWIGGLLIVAVLLLTYWSAASARALDDEETQMVYAVILHGLYWMLIAVLSATSIAQEKESDTWTLLLAAPLRAPSIVMGKLLGLSRRMLWPTLLILAHFTVFAVAGVINFPVLLMILWIVITFNAVWAALGVYLSLRMKKVTTAVIINLIVPVVMFIGVPVVLVVAGELIARTDNWGEVVLWYLPYFYLAQGIDRLCPNFSWSESMYLPWSRGHSVEAGEYLFVIFVVGVLHVAVAALIVWHTIRSFDRFVGRAQQLRLDRYIPRTGPLAASR